MKTTSPTDIAVDVLTSLMVELVGHKEDFAVRPIPGRASTHLQVACHPEDSGCLIGERGANFKACGWLCRLMGNRLEAHFQLLPIPCPPVPMSRNYAPFKPDPEWPEAMIVALLLKAGRAIFQNGDALKVEVEHVSPRDTLLSLVTAQAEPDDAVRIGYDALSVLLDAIGKANGRILTLSIQEAKAA